MNSFFVFLIFLGSCTRGALARIWPAVSPAAEPPAQKVFALSDAAWQELRGGVDPVQQTGDSKSGDEQKQPPKAGDEQKEAPKAGDDQKEPPQSADSDKGRSGGGEDKSGAPNTGEGEQGPGGGDGDMGGSGG